MKPRAAQQSELLHRFREICRQGQAENEPEDENSFLHHFLPIQAHFRVLDPDVRLVIGDKGAGKTHLFRVLEIESGRRGLIDLARQKGLPIPHDSTTWLVGFQTKGMEFPPGGAIGYFAKDRSSVDLQSFWLALLIRVLLRARKISETDLPAGLAETVTAKTWDLAGWVRQATEAQGGIFAALDSLEESLRSSEQVIFISYDELDRVSPGDWDALRVVLQGLVQFWAAYGRRWRQLRPKLFLRRDLYQRAALFGPDIAKIAANRAELVWQIHEFYGALFKRLLNDSLFQKYLQTAKIPQELSASFGYLPLVREEGGYKPAVDRLFEEYMGPDPRKGLTLRWIPNHLKDGHGRIYPRALLRLVEEAAELEVRDKRAQGKLIHHTALRGALDRVSEFRVQELAQEEFPWIEEIRSKLERAGLRVPGERKIFLQVLNIDWERSPHRPPVTQPAALLDYLVELGIFSSRRDGRVDVGDLYLKGFGLKRKGGVARPKGSTVEAVAHSV